MGFAFFLGGLGVAGQPQVVSRVMTLGSDRERKQAMVWFFVWQTPFIAPCWSLDGPAASCSHKTVLTLNLGCRPSPWSTRPLLGWVILASIFAATMSTADSQVLAARRGAATPAGG